MVQTLLEWVSANYSFIKDGSIEKIIDLVMEHAFAYLAENKGLLRNHHDVTDMLVKMRGTYTSSRQSSPQLMEIKELTEDMIKKALNIRGESVLASVRTAFCLFLLIRAFTQQHYKTK
jgi:acetone carboxylase gamma subunit